MRQFSTEIPKLISREFGDEVVIANYETGIYYSLKDSAAQIWLGLRAGLAVEDIVDQYAQRKIGNTETLRLRLEEFIERLLSEGIVIPVEKAGKRDFQMLVAEAFKLPVIERFDDLRDLLLLDPVHDVSDTGWPTRADDAD